MLEAQDTTLCCGLLPGSVVCWGVFGDYGTDPTLEQAQEHLTQDVVAVPSFQVQNVWGTLDQRKT